MEKSKDYTIGFYKHILDDEPAWEIHVHCTEQEANYIGETIATAKDCYYTVDEDEEGKKYECRKPIKIERDCLIKEFECED